MWRKLKVKTRIVIIQEIKQANIKKEVLSMI